MIKSKLMMIMLLIQTLLISGCWDAQELTDLALITGVGIDKTENGDYDVSFQYINAGEVATGQEAGGARGASPTVIFSATGKTIFEAGRRVSQQVSRKNYFPHTSVIVIGEQLAKEEGIEKVIDIFERQPEFRTYTQVVIARGTKAKDVLTIQSPVVRINAKKIINLVEGTEAELGENIVNDLDDIIQTLVSNGKELTITGIEIAGPKKEAVETPQKSESPTTLEASGVALFKEGKLLRWLDGGPARGLLWILDRIESTTLSLDYKEEKDCISIEVIRSRTKLKSVVENEKTKFQITIKLEVSIAAANCAIDLEKLDTINLLQEQLGEEIKKEVINVVEIAQNEKSDIFGFGNVLHRQHPKIWKKIEDDWPELFSTSEVDVQVETFIRRTGMRKNPFHSEK